MPGRLETAAALAAIGLVALDVVAQLRRRRDGH